MIDEQDTDRINWWDLYRIKRQVQWSTLSTIFTPHPFKPIVLARLFSSSSHFSLPPPQIIANSLNAYNPPSIISPSPDNNSLFAYFPGHLIDPIAVLWRRGQRLDEWSIVDVWKVHPSAAIIAADWAWTQRQWSFDHSTGSSKRLPLRGPRLPVPSPILLLVTQTYQLTICYHLHPSVPLVKSTTCLLNQSAVSQEGRGNTFNENIFGPGTVRFCTKAAIALGYNEHSILIAMHSRLLPCTNSVPNPTMFDPSLEQPSSFTPQVDSSMAWPSWGDEPSIDLCQVNLNFDAFTSIGLTSHPLPPIHLSKSFIDQISFVSTPPSPNNHKYPADEIGMGRIYLCTSLLDFKNYSSTPTSELIVHSISRDPSSSSKNDWLVHHEATRSFSSDVLAFFAPCIVPNPSSHYGIYAGLLDTSGTLSQRHLRANKVAVGKLVVIRLPDLIDDDEWESTMIFSPASNAEGDLPSIAAVSPNNCLICTISSSTQSTSISVHRLPRPKQKKLSIPDGTSTPLFSFMLASAIRSRKSIADLSHTLSRLHTDDSEVVDVLYHTISILENDDDGLQTMRSWELLGAAVEIFRTRALRATNSTTREKLTARWQTAHDMCSVAACDLAFKDCQDGPGYDLEAVWQLVGLSGWFMDLLGKLMRDAVVLASDCLVSQPKVEDSDDDLFSSISLSSDLLHLVQPYALSNLHSVLQHVKQFRDYLGGKNPTTENSQMVKDVLLDVVDCSGINLGALYTALEEFVGNPALLDVNGVQKSAVEDEWRSLALCHPTGSMVEKACKVARKLTDSSILDKSLLFLKPSNLAGGVSLPSSFIQQKNDMDVVSKVLLLKSGPSLHCQRCGGRSQVRGNTSVAGHISLRWHTWEGAWMARCICGGNWTVDRSIHGIRGAGFWKVGK